MAALDIAIAGAGVGGLAAALGLARLGHRVVLVEKFAEPRPLGSGLILQPTGLGVLQSLGLIDEIRAHGRRIHRLFGKSGGRVVLDVAYAALGDVEAVAVHRSALFGALFSAVEREAGVSLERGFEVAGLERYAGGRPALVAQDGKRIGPFDLVVDAAGARSPLSADFPARRRALGYGAIWANVPWPGAPFDQGSLEQRYARAHAMTGVLPIGRRFGEAEELAAFFWSIKPERFADWRARGLGRWRDDVARLWPEAGAVVDGVVDLDQMILAAYGHHTLARPYRERLAVIGDAAHATSPQLGQGANMALLDAEALTAAVAENPDPERAPEAYARARRAHVRLYQAMSAAFTPFYQSDSRVLPALRDWMFAPVSRAPGMDRMLAALVAGSVGRKALSPPAVRSQALR
ncbi:NAD(P)/FAD-dependent oxidoreductase [Methylopila sp. M107]|uniref:FAD-dependent oxidoreductase n=1 Tax=Methylopila sp. M107 TaxID=1101190 RepID=UPI00036EC0D2|nr:NAD(P)/FAD-dependent oxidoreductase [Methylopila sp. M107]